MPRGALANTERASFAPSTQCDRRCYAVRCCGAHVKAGKYVKALKFTDYLAIYAAALSSVVFIWNVLQSRPRLKVDLLLGSETVEGITTSGLSIVVRNTSSQDIHLAGIDLLYPYHDVKVRDRLLHLWRYKRWPNRVGWCRTSLSNYCLRDGCPMCLDARRSHHVLVPQPVVEQILSQATRDSIIAIVQDQLWNNAYSRPFQWLRVGSSGRTETRREGEL